MNSNPSRLGINARTMSAVARRPDLWLTAARVGAGLVPQRWWTNMPPLPLPDQRWLRFRMTTAYGGDGTAEPSPQELLDYLEWCRDFPR